jgi:5-methylcytosine-specific restriction endonuclease McrA
MFVDGKSIRLRARTDDPGVSEINEADVLTRDFAREHSRPLTRAETVGLACWEAARTWADWTAVAPKTVYRRLRRGAKIPVQPGESSLPAGLSFGDAVEGVLFILPQAACYYCGAPAGPDGLEIDHAIPVLRGGEDRPENRLPACRSCNQAKYDRTYEGFRAEMAGQYGPPTFFGETDVARRVLRYTFDPGALPDRLPGRPMSRPEQETNTSRHLEL